jgi:hypothetical protein
VKGALDKNRLPVQWFEVSRGNSFLFKIWETTENSYVFLTSILTNLTTDHLDAVAVTKKGKEVRLSHDAMKFLDLVLSDELSPHDPLPAVFPSSALHQSPHSPAYSISLPSPPPSPPSSISSHSQPSVDLPLQNQLPTSPKHVQPATSATNQLTGDSLYGILSRCSCLKNILNAALDHPKFPASQLFEAELSILKRLANMDKYVVVFASRFTFTLDNKQQVYVRGIESQRCQGTLALLPNKSIRTITESLVTQDLIPVLKPITIAKQRGIKDLLKNFKFSKLDKLSSSDTSASFEFACVALNWKSRGTPQIIVVGGTQQVNNELCELLKSSLNTVYHSLSGEQGTEKRPGLCDIPLNSPQDINLSEQTRILNCLPAFLPVPAMNVFHKYTKPMLSFRQSMRHCALIGTTPSDFQVSINKFQASPTTKQLKTRGGKHGPSEEYGFPDVIAPASDSIPLPPNSSAITVSPFYTSVSTNWIQQFLSRGVIRCVDNSVDQLIFLSNGK